MLTIGMATYKDYEGVYFTLQALTLYHRFKVPVEILVIDTYGTKTGCELTKSATLAVGGRYLHAPNFKGTSAPRDLVFREAKYPYVICIDCHVLFAPGAVESVLDHYQKFPDSSDLIQGPLLLDDHRGISTHFDPTWAAQMWGVWGTDKRGYGHEPFEIPMQGLGMFSMRKDAWPGFNKHFRGFGGEEGYLHEKVRRLGGKALCLPAAKWVHRFNRPGGVPYKIDAIDRIVNYFVGHRELGLDEQPVIDHFSKEVGAAAVAKAKEMTDRLVPRGPVTHVFNEGKREESPAVIGQDSTPVRVTLVPKEIKTAEDQKTFFDSSDHRVVTAKPEERVLIVGAWYTNNAAPPLVLAKSLASIKTALEGSIHDVAVLTSCREPVPGNPFRDLPPFDRLNSHLGIIMQIMRILHAADGGRRGRAGAENDCVAFLEHDVLYPPDYFDAIAEAMKDRSMQLVLNENLIGLRPNGWVKSIPNREPPLHQMAMRIGAALRHFEARLSHYARVGIHSIEPYDLLGGAKRISTSIPAVHINHGNHFTTHHQVYYEQEAFELSHDYWGEAVDYLIQVPTTQPSPLRIMNRQNVRLMKPMQPQEVR